MAIQTKPRGEGGLLETLISGPSVGIDTKSAVVAGNTAPALRENKWESLSNMRVYSGQPTRMAGSTLYATGFVMPDNTTPLLAAPYTSSGGSQSWVIVSAAGTAYNVTVSSGTATITQVRAGLSTSPVFWSSVQLGDYLIACNRSDSHWKWNGTSFIPLGAKIIKSMESSETWSGGSAETTTIREGTQARTTGSIAASGTVNLNSTLSSLSVSAGLLLAKAYPTTGSVVGRIHFYVNLSVAARLATATSFIRIETTAGTDYFERLASGWGTLVDGWNEVEINIDAFTSTGSPLWTDIDNIHIRTVATGAGALTAVYDDLYVHYASAETMPPALCNAEFKGVYFSADTTTNGRSAVQFARTGGPDQYDSTAFFQVKQTDGSNMSGMYPFYNQLFLTKENSCHSLSVSLSGTVYPNYNFDLQQITVRHGCTSQRSLVEDGQRKLWMHWRGEFWKYDGQKTEYMSDDIEPTCYDLNFGRLTQVVGGYFQLTNELWWSFPAAADTTSNTVLVRYSEDAGGGWLNAASQTIMGILPTYVSGEEQFITVGATGRFLEQNRGTTFDGTAIVCVARPPWLAMDDYYATKTWLETVVNFVREASGGGTVTLQYRVADHPNEMNAASFATLATFDNSQTTGESFGRAFVGDRAKWLQLQLTTSGVPLTVFWPWIVQARLQHSVY